MGYFAKKRAAKSERRGKMFMSNPAAYLTAAKNLARFSGGGIQGWVAPSKAGMKRAEAQLKKQGKGALKPTKGKGKK